MPKLLLALLICSAAQAQERYGSIVFPNSGKALEQFQASLLRTPNRAMSLADAERAATSDVSRSSKSSGRRP